MGAISASRGVGLARQGGGGEGERVFVVGAVRLPARVTPTELELGEPATNEVPAEERHTRQKAAFI